MQKQAAEADRTTGKKPGRSSAVQHDARRDYPEPGDQDGVGDVRLVDHWRPRTTRTSQRSRSGDRQAELGERNPNYL